MPLTAHPYGPADRCVLHVDVDAFFCQVEVLRNPSLQGVPLAIQQDQDIIAVNYPARMAGVKKHMQVAKARELLSAVGGCLPHAFTADDGRVSYRPYREASGALMRLLQRGLPPDVAQAVLVVEKASIDEAFMLLDLNAAAAAAAVAQYCPWPQSRHSAQPGADNPCSSSSDWGAQTILNLLPSPPPPQQQQQLLPGLDIPLSEMPVWTRQDPPQASSLGLSGQPGGGCQAWTWDLKAAVAVAEAVRQAVAKTLGLTVSVGVAPNKLLAKLASRAAKPDGVHSLDSVAAVQQLLAATPVDRLPGLGGAVASALSAGGITHIAQLQTAPPAQVAVLCGGPTQMVLAAKLQALGWGRDTTPVVERGPPKSIQVRMTLTAQRMQLLPGAQQQAAAAARAAAAGATTPGATTPGATVANQLPAGVADGSSAAAASAAAAAADTAAAIGPVGVSSSSNSRSSSDVPDRCLLSVSADGFTRITAVLRAMSGDLLGRVVLDRHTEGRWPSKLTVTLLLLPLDHTSTDTKAQQQQRYPNTSKATPRSTSRSCPFPPLHHRHHHQQQQQPDQQDGVPPAAVAAAVASGPPSSVAAAAAAATTAAATTTAAAAFHAPGVLGEKTFAVSPELHTSVVEAAAGLAQSIMTQAGPLPHVVLQVNIAASNFVPLDAVKPQGGDIRAHFAKRLPKPAEDNPAAEADEIAAGGQQQAAGQQQGLPPRKRQRQNVQQQQQQGLVLPQPAGGNPAAVNANSATELTAAQHQPQGTQRAAAVAAAAAAATGGQQQQRLLPPRKRQRQNMEQQQQQQSLVQLPRSAVASSACVTQPDVVLLQRQQQQHSRSHQPQDHQQQPQQQQQQQQPPQQQQAQKQQQQQQFVHVPLHPPAKLSQLLLGLCDPQLTADAARADLERILAEAARANGGGTGGPGQQQHQRRLFLL